MHDIGFLVLTIGGHTAFDGLPNGLGTEPSWSGIMLCIRWLGSCAARCRVQHSWIRCVVAATLEGCAATSLAERDTDGAGPARPRCGTAAQLVI